MKEYKNHLGQLHRTDGPAVEWNNGDKHWYINGKRHRVDGPAVENHVGSLWWNNGKCHREDGPAIEYKDGTKQWYLNGIKYTKEEYNQEIVKIKLKRLVEL